MKYPFYFSLVLFLCCNLPVAARQNGCKAKVKANRKKTISFDGTLQALELSFSTAENHEVTLWYKSGYDSVLVRPASGMPALFIVSRSGTVLSPFIRYTDDRGMLLTDSLDQGRTGAGHQYFGLYKSDHVSVTFNASENSRLYYNTRGRDSFFTAQYPQGSSKSTWYDRRGTDTATRRWSPDGTMTYYSNKDGIRIYTREAALETHTYDTLITNRVVSCRKTYYPDGKLRVVSYHFDDAPCGTWLFYDRKGKLSGKKKYPAPNTLPQIGMVVSIPDPPRSFVSVEEEAGYPGGSDAFKTYVNGQLPALLCQSAHSLSGRYEIRLQIDNTGKANILGISGLNADKALADAVELMLRSSGRWKPAKRNGRAASLTFLMPVTVQ